MNKSQVLEILSENNLLPESKFGQNFLCDEEIIEEIISVSNISDGESVLEIGPGIGALTVPLSEMDINLTCVEIDKRIAQYLSESEINAEVICSDYLKLNDYDKESYTKAISNIPYYVMTPIIKKLICDLNNCDQMTFMIEEDALDRVIAKPKTKQYGPLSVILNLYGTVSKEFNVPGHCFYPVPKTMSCVITVKKNTNDYVLDENVMEFIEKCFAMRRKKLLNNLSMYSKDKVLKALAENGLPETVRAEELEGKMFIKLYNDIIK